MTTSWQKQKAPSRDGAFCFQGDEGSLLKQSGIIDRYAMLIDQTTSGKVKEVMECSLMSGDSD